MLAAALTRLLLALVDIVTLPVRLLIALLPGQQFHFRWLGRRVAVDQ